MPPRRVTRSGAAASLQEEVPVAAPPQVEVPVMAEGGNLEIGEGAANVEIAVAGPTINVPPPIVAPMDGLNQVFISSFVKNN